jgi:hypothetical protein
MRKGSIWMIIIISIILIITDNTKLSIPHWLRGVLGLVGVGFVYIFASDESDEKEGEED